MKDTTTTAPRRVLSRGFFCLLDWNRKLSFFSQMSPSPSPPPPPPPPLLKRGKEQQCRFPSMLLALVEAMAVASTAGRRLHHSSSMDSKEENKACPLLAGTTEQDKEEKTEQKEEQAVSKGKDIKRKPGVVARLMGLDLMPSLEAPQSTSKATTCETQISSLPSPSFEDLEEPLIGDKESGKHPRRRGKRRYDNKNDKVSTSSDKATAILSSSKSHSQFTKLNQSCLPSPSLYRKTASHHAKEQNRRAKEVKQAESSCTITSTTTSTSRRPSVYIKREPIISISSLKEEKGRKVSRVVAEQDPNSTHESIKRSSRSSPNTPTTTATLYLMPKKEESFIDFLLKRREARGGFEKEEKDFFHNIQSGSQVDISTSGFDTERSLSEANVRSSSTTSLKRLSDSVKACGEEFGQPSPVSILESAFLQDESSSSSSPESIQNFSGEGNAIGCNETKGITATTTRRNLMRAILGESRHPCIKTIDTIRNEEDYIAKVMECSKLNYGDDVIFYFLGDDAQPIISPSVFMELETQSDEWEWDGMSPQYNEYTDEPYSLCSKFKCKKEIARSYRKLIFDCVNDALGLSLKAMMMNDPRKYRLFLSPNCQCYIEKRAKQQVKEWKAACGMAMDGLVEGDINAPLYQTSWIDSSEASLDILLGLGDIEHSILELLIEELLFSMTHNLLKPRKVGLTL